ncbi:MAG: ATP-binding cassette domain-containing protein [Clostridia bacterium]
MEFKDVCLSFEGRQVLDHFTLPLVPGSTTCLSGKSGAGKTSVFNLMLGFLKPDAGLISGFEALRLAVVFQEERLIEHMSALENVLLTAPRTVTREVACAALASLNLTDARSPVRVLSGGERRRVSIVRAMLPHPELLLLDEPFKGLDAKMRETCARYILSEKAGATVVVITHDQAEGQMLKAQYFAAIS